MRLLTFLLFSLIAIGCDGGVCGNSFLPSTSEFTLYVSNQSTANPVVDILVEIDGEVVVDEPFDVGSGASWKTIPYELDKGQHTIVITSVDGNASHTETFSVTGQRWAVINYLYVPLEIEEQFEFEIHFNPPELE